MTAVGGDSGIPFGNYTLLRRIARGGMAEVFVARQKGIDGFDRLVAIKRILPHLLDDKSFVGMFQDEARLAARLSHPNIIHIYDFGKVEEHFFIAMQFMHGVHAGDLIRLAEDQPMPPSLVARIGADACAGLHYAHNRRDERGAPLKLVHRDVSPPNLLVSYDGVVKIVDFGIAKAVSSIEQTRPGVVKGKYAYMSPEQTMGKKLDGRSDVFSLAIVLWELLAGVPAVTRSDQVLAMKTIRDGKVPSIESVRDDIPKPLAAALRGALQKEPKKRSDARTFGNQLESFLKASSEIATSMELGAWLVERSPPDEVLGAEKTGFGTRQATMATSLKGGSAMLSQLGELDAPRTPDGARGSVVSALAGLPGAENQQTQVLTASGDLQAHDASHATQPLDDSVLINNVLVGDEYTSTTSLLPDAVYVEPTGELEELNFDDENEPTAMVQAPMRTAILPRLPASAPSQTQEATAPGYDGLELPTEVDEEEPAPALEFVDNDRTYEDHQVPMDVVHGFAAAPAPIRGTVQIQAAAKPTRGSGYILWILGGLVLALVAVVAVGSGEDDEAAAARPDAQVAALGDADMPASLPPMVVTPLPGTSSAAIDAGTSDAANEPMDAAPINGKTGKPGTTGKSDKRRKKPARRVMGRLAVKTSPYSVVYHQGRKLGTTPMANLPLPPGRYRLVFKNPEFGNVSKTAVIRSGKTTKLDFALEP